MEIETILGGFSAEEFGNTEVRQKVWAERLNTSIPTMYRWREEVIGADDLLKLFYTKGNKRKVSGSLDGYQRFLLSLVGCLVRGVVTGATMSYEEARKWFNDPRAVGLTPLMEDGKLLPPKKRFNRNRFEQWISNVD